MKLKILAVALALVAIGLIYFLFFAGPGTDAPDDPLAQNRASCGGADALKGDHLASCVAHALDLMGTANVPMDDDKARALLKKTCDQAYAEGCDLLARFDQVKLEVVIARCKGASSAPDPKSCRDAGRRYELSIGMEPHPRNLKPAREYYSKACSLGDQAGCTSRDQVSPDP